GVGWLAPRRGGAGGGGRRRRIGAGRRVDRLPGRLAGQVPQGDVHRPDGPPRRLPVAREQRLVEALALERILVHHERLERADQRLGVELRAAARRAQEGGAFRALVGAGREQAELALAAEPPGVLAVGGGGEVVPAAEG